jgi:hypothetical protein
MAYRRFTDRTTLIEARESTEYTFEALDAYPDEAVHTLGQPLDAHLAKLATLEASRRKARRMGTLKLRKDVLTAQAEVEADIARAIERLDRAWRSVDGGLTTFAAERDLPADFNERFFPAASGATKKRAAPDREPKPA